MSYVQLAQCWSQWLSFCPHLESKGVCRLHQVVLQSLLPPRRVARQTPHHLHRQTFRQRTSESRAKHAHFADKHMNERYVRVLQWACRFFGKSWSHVVKQAHRSTWNYCCRVVKLACGSCWNSHCLRLEYSNKSFVSHLWKYAL